MKKGEWKVAIENMDAYMTFYDSIQIMIDNEELVRLMDKHQLEEHKRQLSEHARTVLLVIFLLFLASIIMCVFGFMLKDRKRKKRIIDLQQELNQKRVDVSLLRNEASEATNEQIDKRRIELLEQQIHLCKLMFQSTDSYEALETVKKATPKQLLDMDYLREEIKDGIWRSFVDVMNRLNEEDAKLTTEDQYFCVLIMLNCSKTVIMELMQVSSDALKTRKNRIKNKMNTELFKFVFNSDNQCNTKM